MRLFHMPPFHTAGVAMLVFALCEAVAVFAESNARQLKETAQRQRLADENAALESLSRMKSEYLANISHETQTPLTIISTSFQLISTLLTDAKVEDGEWKISTADGTLINEAAASAQESILRAKRITQSNLRLASMQESREKMTVINISNLIINGAIIRMSLAEKRGNKLNINVPENLPQVFGNADNLTQVLDNLLTNANNHTKGGNITVTGSADDKTITVTVTDSGAGIPTDLRPHVFQRGISGSGGTGIGLALCKNMIDSHGGDIFLQSEQGKGTAVTFTLPIYNEGGAADV
jgi:signal transduction histidine kinase